MKNRIIVSIAAGMISTASLPSVAGAQDAATIEPAPMNRAAGDWSAHDDLTGHDFGARLDAVRRHYSGKLIRFRLAGMLATQETAIGIRTDQKDAWRNYTAALLALVPEREAMLDLIGDADEDPKGPEAFARAEAVADVLTDYATKAGALKQAITALRAALTPEQLEAARVPRLSHG